MKIATYNVNSVNARMENLAAWLSETRPDIVLLQEIKAEFNAFPFWDLQMAGYEAKILGQKSYNGVAVLSRGKIKVVSEGLPGLMTMISSSNSKSGLCVCPYMTISAFLNLASSFNRAVPIDT